jgi:hypothetical protein
MLECLVQWMQTVDYQNGWDTISSPGMQMLVEAMLVVVEAGGLAWWYQLRCKIRKTVPI